VRIAAKGAHRKEIRQIRLDSYGLVQGQMANLYNDQRNAQVFNLFIYLLLPYMFRAFF
jgi:hypothetical protein